MSTQKQMGEEKMLFPSQCGFYLNTLLRTKRLISMYRYDQTGPSSTPHVFSPLPMYRLTHHSQTGHGRISSNFVLPVDWASPKVLILSQSSDGLQLLWSVFVWVGSMELCCFQAQFQFSCFDFKLSCNEWSTEPGYYLSNNTSEPTDSPIPSMLRLCYYFASDTDKGTLTQRRIFFQIPSW